MTSVTTKFCSKINIGSTHCELSSGGKVCHLRLSYFSIAICNNFFQYFLSRQTVTQ